MGSAKRREQLGKKSEQLIKKLETVHKDVVQLEKYCPRVEPVVVPLGSSLAQNYGPGISGEEHPSLQSMLKDFREVVEELQDRAKDLHEATNDTTWEP